MIYRIVVDKQPMENPSNEKRVYEVDIEELRQKGDICDSLIINDEETYVIRRLKLSEYHVLSVLDEPIKEPLEMIDMELFEGKNYIYLEGRTGNYMSIKYLVKNQFTDLFATKSDVRSSVKQAAKGIELSVQAQIEGLVDKEEMKSAIEIEVGKITEAVSNSYATKGELQTEKSERVQSANSIIQNVSKKVGKDEVISSINQSAEKVRHQC